MKIGIDVGAGNGGTLYKFKDCEIIYAFEAFPDGYTELINKKNPKVKPLNVGISSIPGIKEFNAYHIGNPPAHGCGSFLEIDKSGEFTKILEKKFNMEFKSKTYNIECIRLDSFIKEHNITSIEYLKIDTQGSDYDVIISLGEEITKVKKIEVEIILKDFYINQGSRADIVSYLENNNFKLIQEDWNEGAENYETNAIFINKKYG